MKKFLQVFELDFQKEAFTRREWIVYGVIAPTVLVIICTIADIINSL